MYPLLSVLLLYFLFNVIVCFWDGKEGGSVLLVLLTIPRSPWLCDSQVMVVSGAGRATGFGTGVNTEMSFQKI